MERKYTHELDGKILGINIRYYPTQNGLGCMGTVTVLVAGAIGDYAAYTGHGHPHWVALHSDKISFAEAKCHFPSIEEANYRS